MRPGLGDETREVRLEIFPGEYSEREGTIEKARLALSLDRGTVKIVSGKNWIGRNPRGKKINFKIVGGNKFFQSDEWTLDD